MEKIEAEVKKIRSSKTDADFAIVFLLCVGIAAAVAMLLDRHTETKMIAVYAIICVVVTAASVWPIKYRFFDLKEKEKKVTESLEKNFQEQRELIARETKHRLVQYG